MLAVAATEDDPYSQLLGHIFAPSRDARLSRITALFFTPYPRASVRASLSRNAHDLYLELQFNSEGLYDALAHDIDQPQHIGRSRATLVDDVVRVPLGDNRATDSCALQSGHVQQPSRSRSGGVLERRSTRGSARRLAPPCRC